MTEYAMRTVIIEDLDRVIARARSAGVTDSEIRWLFDRGMREQSPGENPPIFTSRRFGDPDEWFNSSRI